MERIGTAMTVPIPAVQRSDISSSSSYRIHEGWGYTAFIQTILEGFYRYHGHMDVGLEVERGPLSPKGKAFIAMGIALLVISWSMATYYYNILPDVVPTHYDLYGRPNGWGSKAGLLLAPTILTGVYVALLTIIKYRYTMIERYPYLVNMPAFMALMGSD